MRKILLLSVFVFTLIFSALGAKADSSTVNPEKIYVLKLQKEIAAPSWRMVKLAMQAAKDGKYNRFILHLNTYGGRVDFADSIRSAFLSFSLPTAVYIQENAASAGALISISCDSIYMSPGASIGAATVVDGQGAVASEKYQSFFRSKMRATASAKNRNPDIAQAMVDKSIEIEGLVDDETLITFTSEEAQANGFCEGIYDNFTAFTSEVYPNAEITFHKTSATEKIILFLINPAISSVLILIIIGGIYFELQSPGVGFPILASVLAAVAFFAPHYLQGLVENWEILIFITGIILIAVEIFVIPGFGVAGILGLILLISGLALSLVSVVPSEDYGWITPNLSSMMNAFAIVLVTMVVALVLSYYLSKKLFSGKSYFASKTMVMADNSDSRINLSANISNEDIVGKVGVSVTNLMPGGKIIIQDESFDALALNGFLEKGTKVKVLRVSNVQLIVKAIEEE